MLRIVAVSGDKNSGKTTLCRRILEELVRVGIRTGYIKRTSEAVLSPQDTDMGDTLRAGFETAIWGSDGVRVESADTSLVSSTASIEAKDFPDAEIVIMEGGKDLPIPKVWVCSEGENAPDLPGIFLIYDRYHTGDGKKFFGIGDERQLAFSIAALARGEAYRSARVYIGSRELSMKNFIADFVRGGILGMLSSLKDADIDGAVKIYLDR